MTQDEFNKTVIRTEDTGSEIWDLRPFEGQQSKAFERFLRDIDAQFSDGRARTHAKSPPGNSVMRSRLAAARTIAYTDSAMLGFASPDIDLESQRRIAGCHCIPQPIRSHDEVHVLLVKPRWI